VKISSLHKGLLNRHKVRQRNKVSLFLGKFQ
jgi:hypothetical protein